MVRTLKVPLFLVLLISWARVGALAIAAETDKRPAPLVHQAPASSPTAAYRLLDVVLEASARDVDLHRARPTILSRTMAVALTAMYDAWAAYDDRAIGTRLGDQLRRPKNERTEANKEIAISYAVFRALLNVYPDDSAWIEAEMRKLGSDPRNDSTDLATPAGVGNVAAAAVIDYRQNDGANQSGSEPGGNGQAYSDYTYYRPLNSAANIASPTLWLPIEFRDPNGKTFSPGFLTPHWYRVRPFALERAEQFRPPPPPEFLSENLKKEVDECIALNASLDLRQKAIVEFMRDGPRSTGQSGHWLRFAQDVSRRDGNDLDRDVKLFFCVSNVVLDTFIASWEAKRFYDTSRPYWWVRLYYPGKKIHAWAGPGQGTRLIPAEKWRPYSPESFITPPFPGYVSGHATASGGAARLLELFTGSDEFGAVAARRAGELTENEFSTAEMQSVDGKPNLDIPESKEILLELPTFSSTAVMAAESRLLGGYHIRTDNDEGLILGRKVADHAWPKFQAYFEGTAPQPRSPELRIAAE